MSKSPNAMMIFPSVGKWLMKSMNARMFLTSDRSAPVAASSKESRVMSPPPIR